MEKVVHNGKVSELNMNGNTYLALVMPRKPEDVTMSFPLEGVLSNQEIFKPYLGKLISITIEKEEGKIRQITIAEEKEANQRR